MTKSTVLDVLMYLFEHHLDEDADIDADQEQLRSVLVQAGFAESEVSKAFAWLEELTVGQPGAAEVEGAGVMSTRIYTAEEQKRLDLECRSLMLFLEQVGVLDRTTRELVIDRVLALEAEEVDIEQLKWVVLMVMFNQPGRENVIPWMEELVFERSAGNLH